MGSELSDIIIPSIAFFVAFFISFNLVEALMGLLLRYFIFSKATFFTDVLLRYKIYHGSWIKPVSLVFLLGFTIGFLKFTAFIDILWYASWGVKIFALEMILAIYFIYLLSTHRLPRLHFMKKIYQYLFAYLSIIVYILMVVLINQYYDVYQHYINAKIVYPIQHKGSLILDNRERQKLLTEFRYQIYSNTCPAIDFTEIKTDSGIQNFVYVTTNADLKTIQKPINRNNPKAYLSGRLCSDGNKSFLLTDYGQWYWVIKENEKG